MPSCLDAEVIWRVLRPISGKDLRRAPRLRLVQQLGTGVDAIDVECARRLVIAVTNMPGANAPSVAEGTVLLMIAALRRLPELDRATRSLTGWPPDLSLGGERPQHRRVHRRTGRLRQHR
jgi:phosphoglycerate dehydrogenase-like enzyme